MNQEGESAAPVSFCVNLKNITLWLKTLLTIPPKPVSLCEPIEMLPDVVVARTVQS